MYTNEQINQALQELKQKRPLPFTTDKLKGYTITELVFDEQRYLIIMIIEHNGKPGKIEFPVELFMYARLVDKQ